MRGNGLSRLFGTAALFCFAVGLALVPQRADSNSPQDANPPKAEADEPVPAYHAQAPQGELPATMDPELFAQPVVQNAYAVAAKIKKALYQQPCYCHCDRSQGHKSLLDCFASRHGSGCGTCIYEDFYTFEQSNKGKTAAQIRAGIIKGEWKSVDASKYQKPLQAN
ncbi:MAG TPA: CYCXC family (seleno)protein [Candidatus Limnocylindrales bacterium]|nr:CYCXC family (seleno)protein [Candidatus Limnocylindrales bacterium]